MTAGDRTAALEALGLPEEATKEEIEAAYEDLRAVWEPQLQQGNPRIASRAEEELAKIAKARDALLESPTAPSSQGLHPALLGVLMILAFGLGFLAMRAYRKSHAPPAMIVREPSNDGPSSRIRLTPPEVSVTATNPNAVPLTEQERLTIDSSIKDLENGMDAMEARDALIGLNEKAIEPVTRALGSANENVRMNAAMILNSIALGPDDSPNDRKEVARLHPFFDAAHTLEALSKVKTDSNSETRLNVAYALGNLLDPAGYPPLLSMAGDESAEVRAGVAYALGRLDNPEAVPTLIELLNDPEISVRTSAVEALRPFDTPQAKSALTERLPQESDPEIIARIKSVLEGEKTPEDEEP